MSPEVGGRSSYDSTVAVTKVYEVAISGFADHFT